MHIHHMKLMNFLNLFQYYAKFRPIRVVKTQKVHRFSSRLLTMLHISCLFESENTVL